MFPYCKCLVSLPADPCVSHCLHFVICKMEMSGRVHLALLSETACIFLVFDSKTVAIMFLFLEWKYRFTSAVHMVKRIIQVH